MKRSAQHLFVCVSLLLACDAAAQTVDLADPTGRQIVTGGAAGRRAGTWLDVGDLDGPDGNKDLIIGTPDSLSGRGEVRVLYGWVARTGNFSLDDLGVVLTGAAAGDRFGAYTNTGFVTRQETRPATSPRDLIVGAPGAAGGRGEIYVFASPVIGPSLTPADAVFRVTGAAGDRLGSSLETADLNNDGYREIIVGAPNTGRVYVIDYHHFPAATRDLSTAQPGVTTITGTGIGYVLAAGDITADAIFDLAIGAPTAAGGAGAVYIVNGRSSALPATISLPAGANSTFPGIDPGDNAGSGLWIRDFDGNGWWDLAITAVDGDGPANSRPASGEAYIVFGKPSQPAVLAPDVTIFGAAAGHRLGYAIWVGNVTRDEPDDIALLARGANGGFGEGYIVYGRPRDEFSPVIDLASNVDRRIIGDETQGALERIVVWEVTGDGAEEIVFGVPSADAGAGRLYFSVSPTLTAETPGGSPIGGGSLTVNIIVNPGQTWTTPIRLKNRTMVPVTWEVSSNQPWLTAMPTTGSSTASQDGLFIAVASAQGLVPGAVYTGLLRVFTTNRNLETSLGVQVTMRVAAASREPGDFSGDGTFDLIWQHQTSGALALWRMNGTTLMGGDALNPGQVGDTNWKIAGTGDFNGDGHPDLLWHHQTQGLVTVWFMNGLNQVGTASLIPDRVADVNWKIVATGDFNGDGRRDIVWHHQTQGLVSVWLMDGTRLRDGTLLTPDRVTDTNWKVVAAGDFNADGKTDLVWRNQSTGKLSIWLMNGTRLTEGVWMSPDQVADTNWQIKSVGDVNGDGKPDLIWQHATSGALAAWIMNGTVMVSGRSLTPAAVMDLNWKIAGPK